MTADQLQIQDIQIRNLQENDNPALAKIIRATLKEFGANHPGTVYFDPTTDHLFEVFQSAENAAYFVAEHNGRLVGGGGIFPSPGLSPDTCELVKMYLLPEARGIGLGKQLIQSCLDFARTCGYRNVYIETMPELRQAMRVYEKFGFHYLPGPMGNTGHFGCAVWMLKNDL